MSYIRDRYLLLKRDKNSITLAVFDGLYRTSDKLYIYIYIVLAVINREVVTQMKSTDNTRKREIKTNGRAFVYSLYIYIYTDLFIRSFFLLLLLVIIYCTQLDRDGDSRHSFYSLPIWLIDRILLPYHIVFAY